MSNPSAFSILVQVMVKGKLSSALPEPNEFNHIDLIHLGYSLIELNPTCVIHRFLV